MLTHIVCWKYKNDVSTSTRNEHIARLRALTDVIDVIGSLSVGSDVLGLDRSFDTGLVATFAGRTELDVYNEHPAHQEVAALGRSVAEKVISVDFLAEPAKS